MAALTERARLLALRKEEIQEEMDPLIVQRDAQEQRVRAARARVEELKAQVAAQEERAATLEAELEELRRRAQEWAGQRVQAEKELEARLAQQKELEAAIAEARAAEARLETERELLARMREEGAGFTQGTRSLLHAALPGVEGVLGRLIRVEEEAFRGTGLDEYGSRTGQADLGRVRHPVRRRHDDLVALLA